MIFKTANPEGLVERSLTMLNIPGKTPLVLFLMLLLRLKLVDAFVATTNRKRACTRQFRSTTQVGLNRFLFDRSEVDWRNEETPTVTLPKDDYRTRHAAKILSLHNGDTVRSGVVSCDEHQGGLITDAATIEWLPEGKVKKAEPLRNGNPPGSLRVHLLALQSPIDVLATPPVSLILALPRPLQLGRLLPMVAQMGVDRLILTEARKVPKDYFGSHLFRKPALLTEKLVEGLCQAGDVRLPTVHVVRHLSNFLNHDLDVLFPSDAYARVIAHPQRMDDESLPNRVRHVNFPDGPQRRMVIAVGPEGGWEEPEELERFQQHGFQPITMGTRVLRSDCAVVSLLSLAHDVCSVDYDG
jgi:RsmE family RNA methyltransferase